MGITKNSNVLKDKEVNTSMYDPSEEVKDVLEQVQKDFHFARLIREGTYTEFNNRSLIDYQNDCQKIFNAYVPPKSQNPDEAWRANVVRPLTRARAISIAAHLTTNVMFPGVFAQNNRDEQDKEAAIVMKDLMEWSFDQSKYDETFVKAVIGALVNPAVIVYEGFDKVTRKIKDIQEDGSWEWKEVDDDEYSGFFNELVPVDEMYISDVYEHDIQKQPFLIWRRVIDYTKAKQKYGDLQDFKDFVRPGLKIFYSDDRNCFYEEYDSDLEDRLVEEVIYYNRSEDLELVILNGVLITSPDQPIRRKDKKYPFVKTGFEPFDEGRFFYYKSMVDKLKVEQRILDVLYETVINGSILSLMPPSVVYGSEEIDSSVVTPGTVTTFKPDTKFEMLNVQPNLNAGITAIRELEASMAESSTDVRSQGISPSGSQTAFEISRLEQNARTMLGLFGKMIGFLVRDLGKLRLDTILQYMTVGEVMDITGPTARLKFREFVMADREVEGRKKTRNIKFDLNVPEEPIEEEEAMETEFKILEKEGGPKGDKEIMFVNPKLFRDLKFKVTIEPDIKPIKSEALQKALNLEAYDRAIQNPLANQESIFRDFLLESFVPGESDRYVKKQQAMPEQQPMGGPAPSKELTSQLTGAGTKAGSAELSGIAGMGL